MAIETVKNKVQTYQEESEKWKTGHDQAMDCLEFELHLLFGNSVYKAINFIDEHVRSIWRNGKKPYCKETDDTIFQLYQQWFGVGKEMEARLLAFEKEGFVVQHSKPFRKALREVSGILQDDAEFFSDEKLVKLRDEAIEQHRRGSCEVM